MSTERLVGSFDPGRIIALYDGHPVPVGAYLADVAHLAAHVPPGAFINACVDRYRFLVGLGAALSLGRTTLLPANHATETLAQLMSHDDHPFVLSDEPAMHGAHVVAYVDARQRGFSADNPPVAPDLVAVRAFTSGSTGTPTTHDKTWRSLVIGADLAGERFAIDGSALLGTVPAQHMYGLETTIMLPLRRRVLVHARRPLLPADIGAALQELPAPRRLITSPVHLKALVDRGQAGPVLAGVICSTAPLGEALARRAEEVLQTVVEEIYGATEVGSVASRRTTAGLAWHLYPGLRLQAAAGATAIGGGHLAAPVALEDHIECSDDEHFLWRGRRADLVLVAGKRMSLLMLNEILRGLDGVQDGVFFVPGRPSDAPAERLCAFVVTTRPEAEILAALRRHVDPVFLPRPLYRVEALPRAPGTDKLPRAALIGLYDRQPYQMELWFPAGRSFFADHFPGDPLVPGALLLDALVAGYERHAIGRKVMGVETFKWLKALRPDVPARAFFDGVEGDRVTVVVRVGEEILARGTLRVPRSGRVDGGALV